MRRRLYHSFAIAFLLAPGGTCRANDCADWRGSDDHWVEAVNVWPCLRLPPGLFIITKPVRLSQGHRLIGQGDATVIKADPQRWSGIVSEGVVIVESSKDVNVGHLTLDGSGVAAYLIGGFNFTIENADLRNGRSGAVGIAGTGVVIKSSRLHAIAKDTVVEGKGLFNCEYLASQRVGLPLCTAIYAQGGAEGTGTRDFAPQIIDSEIFDVVGPAIDINRVNGGLLLHSRVTATSGWAAVSLYGSSGWNIRENRISMRHTASWQIDSHKVLTRHGRSAAVFIGTDEEVLPARRNIIEENDLDGSFGVEIIGDPARGIRPSQNVVRRNTYSGSVVRCVSDQVEVVNSDCQP